MAQAAAANSTLGRHGFDLFDCARSMPTLRAIFLILLCSSAVVLAETNAPAPRWIIETEEDRGINYNPQTGEVTFTNRFTVSFGDASLSALRAQLNMASGDIVARDRITLEQGGRVWRGDLLHFNFKTGQMGGGEFRMGQAPFFAAGGGFAGSRTNNLYVVSNGLVTTDDYGDPGYSIRANRITVVPGDYVECENAMLYLGDVPVFWFPKYRRSLKPQPNHWTLTPGYRNVYGPYLLTTYDWYWNDKLSGAIHLDERVKRGPGVGPDITYHLPRFGDGTVKYYYTYDQDPGLDRSPYSGNEPLPNNRQRVWYEHQGTLASNLTLKAAVKWQSDSQLIRDFFETEYKENSQPSTYVDLNKVWPNWSLDLLTMPRVNEFQETVERLPEVKLTGLQQRLGPTPLFYESESSFGYYQRQFAYNNLPGFAAVRADTFHQILLPVTWLDWLNLTPRAGGRYTYYGQATGPGAFTDEQSRWVFDTGAEVSTKASRTWGNVKNEFFDLNGLRHIVQPLINYSYVPMPNVRPFQVPQFDYLLPSEELLPITFPQYNSIDFIDRANVIRFALRNRLQTKRRGEIENVANWSVYSDWRLNPLPGEGTFSDLFSKLDVKPWRWLTLNSYLAYNLNDTTWDQVSHYATIAPNDTWSWTIGQRYMRDNAFYATNGLNFIYSSIYWRANENWGLRASHYYDFDAGVMQEQQYTIYRDLRSWTVAFSFRVVRNAGSSGTDYGGAVTFSLKSNPRFALGQDINRPTLLMGY
jgi:lipopolysaccharide assembly outer membrane protein LptD (OstA)